MRHYFYIILLAFIGTTLSAQHQHRGSCGFHAVLEGYDEQVDRLKHHLRVIREQGGVANARDVQYIPVSFHVGRESDGSGGVNLGRVLDQLCELNEDFAPYDMQFFLSADDGINEINNTSFYTNHLGSANFMQFQRNNAAIDIWIPETANISNEGPGEVLAYYDPSSQRDWIVIGRNFVRANDIALTHEVGHFFGLLHTFNGWEPEPYNIENVPAPVISSNDIVPTETVDGFNCQTAGDFICDTPPDYNNGIGWPNCNFTLNVLDPNGTPIDPDERLYLGYFLECDDPDYYFSDDQVAVMTMNLNSNARNYLRSEAVPPVVEITEEVNLVSPADEETTAGYNAVQLEWESVPGATRYLVEVSRISTFSINPIRKLVYGTSTILPELDPDRRYFWRVRPFNQHNTCASPSETQSFRSGLVVSTTSLATTLDVGLSPNPATPEQRLQLNINSTESFQGTVQVLDLAGRRVINERPLNIAAGEQSISLDISKLSFGLYLVNIQTANGTLTKKLVVTQ